MPNEIAWLSLSYQSQVGDYNLFLSLSLSLSPNGINVFWSWVESGTLLKKAEVCIRSCSSLFLKHLCVHLEVERSAALTLDASLMTIHLTTTSAYRDARTTFLFLTSSSPWTTRITGRISIETLFRESLFTFVLSLSPIHTCEPL